MPRATTQQRQLAVAVAAQHGIEEAAKQFNVSAETIKQWLLDEEKKSGISQVLLDEIEKE